MSLITRCPSCQTMFRVVQDQLRLSEGWVRCGQCDNVFDANAHLVHDLAAAGAEPEAAPHGPAPEAIQPDAMAEFAARQVALEAQGTDGDEALPPVDIKIDIDLPQEDAQREPSFEQLHAYAAAEEQPHEAAHEVPHEELVLEAGAGAHLAEPGMADVAIHHDDHHGDSAEAVAPLGDIALPLKEPPPPSFLRDAKRKTRRSAWHSTGVRALLSLLALVLLAGLATQLLVQERDRLAALRPELKPLLASICQPLGCKLGPLKQIDSMVIDSSSFTKLRGDAYRLNLVIKNNAGTELAAPAVELTLTDLQDKPVLRRVLLNTDFDTKAATVAAGGEWTASAAVGVKPASSTERISGYRVLAFYP